MKKILALTLALAMSLSLAACGGGGGKSKGNASSGTPAGGSSTSQTGGSSSQGTPAQSFKVGVVTPSGDHGFTGESVQQANLMAKEMMAKYDGLDVQVKDGIDASAQINVRLITSVGGREETMQKFENTSLDVKFCTFFFSPSFIRDAFLLGIGALYNEPYQAEQDANGTYLIPSFSITNADLAGDYNFDSYRASEAYENRYAING